MSLEQLIHLTESKGLLWGLGFLVFGSISILSNETLTKKLSGLKWLPRIRARWQREALEEDAAREQAAIQALVTRIQSVQKTAEEERKWFQNRIEDLRVKLDELDRSAEARACVMQAEFDEALAYIRFVTAWAHRVSLWAEENGYLLPPPPWQSFTEWQKNYSKQPPQH